jgi:hypothetical protein
MTRTTCDLCDGECKDVIQVTFKDGEHPHNGSAMYAKIDVCEKCISDPKLQLESSLELSEAIKLRKS